MSYRLTLKSFKEKQEAQDAAIRDLDVSADLLQDRVLAVENARGKAKFDFLSFLIGLFLGGGVVFIALAVYHK